MGGSYLVDALVFLIDTLLSLYILTFILRFLLQWARADFYNPFSQFIVKVTNPLLRPLRRIIPGLFGIDFAGLILILLLEYMKVTIIYLIQGVDFMAGSFAILAVAETLQTVIYVFIFTLIVQAILSWVNPHSYNPMASMLYSLNEPLLRPARRLLPHTGGFDLSPLIVLIILQLSQMLIVHPLRDLAIHLAMR